MPPGQNEQNLTQEQERLEKINKQTQRRAMGANQESTTNDVVVKLAKNYS